MSKLKRIIPPSLLKIFISSKWKIWKNKSNKEIFSKIYSDGIWGKSGSKDIPYYSGGGSHEKNLIDPFIVSISDFLSSLNDPKRVVDLGCGDFNIGSQLIKYSQHYNGCDIVPELIEYNKKKFQSEKITFTTLDITSDELPEGDIVIIRQVLQHLSNEQIMKVLKKVSSTYKYLVLTEALPKKDNFVPNVDIPVGHLTRIRINSGIVIEESPFEFKFQSNKVLSEIPFPRGIIKTILYEL